MEIVRDLFAQDPIFPFALLLGIILVVPLCFERLQLPGLVGLLVAGVVFGPHGLQLLESGSEAMKLLSDIGVVYLMFVAGLEMDIAQFQRVRDRALGFGFLTFLFPLIAGTIVGRWFGFDWNASILLGSLLSSHTPLGYPILSRMGLMGNEAVIVALGGTIFTNIPALLVLAICVGVKTGNFTPVELLILIVSLSIYSAVVLWGVNWVGKEFFRRSGDEEGNQFLFILLAVFVAAVGAQVIGVEKIIGAFLAGMAVNEVVESETVKEKVVFVGSVLFIPMFIINLGLLIDLQEFAKGLASFGLTIAIVGALLGSKWIAAVGTQWLYRYTRAETIAIWSLSIPQVAATLAATIVGYRQGILTEEVLNSAIVMMLVTATLGPWVTARVAGALPLPEADLGAIATTFDETEAQVGHLFTVVVPVCNPETERYLVEMAALLARSEAGQIVSLSIARSIAYMEVSALDEAIARGERLANEAVEFARSMGVSARGILRIDSDVALGIVHGSREQNASAIVMGWSETTSLRSRLFGNAIDSVLWGAHCPVAVTRLLASPMQMQRILVLVDRAIAQSVLSVRVAFILASANQGEVTLLYAGDRHTSPEVHEQIGAQLSQLVAQWSGSTPSQIAILADDDPVGAIVTASARYDLAILRSTRRRTVAGLEIDDLTTQLLRQLPLSLVMLGEPE
ncbi:MAG: sodium:proton antiporter [Cyanobacteria bacterium J007]|nr:MAG: sodium:proton antiporter [Cyanobacteria bacterium J007]